MNEQDDKNAAQPIEPGTIVICPKCQAEHPLSVYLQERRLEPYAEGVLDKVDEMGLLCPDCGDWTHIRYDTPYLKRMKTALDRAVYLMRKSPGERSNKAYYRAKTRYQAAFDETQRDIREVFGGVSPTEMLGQQVTDTPEFDFDEEEE